MSTRRTSHRFQEKGAKKFTSDSEGQAVSIIKISQICRKNKIGTAIL
jgi:hypothetical protein